MDIHQKCDAHLVDRLRPISKDHLKDINKYDRVSVLKQPAIHNLLEVLVSYGDSNRCEEPHTIHTPDKARIGTASWSRSLSIGKSGMSCIFNFGSISLHQGIDATLALGDEQQNHHRLHIHEDGEHNRQWVGEA